MNIAIIGGSGANEVIKELGVRARKNSFVALHGTDYIDFDYNDDKVFFVLRHGADHSKDPARLEPKYMAEKLVELLKPEEEKTLVIQTSASGSLDTSIKLVDEGGIVVCSDVMRGFGYKGSSRSLVGTDNLHAVINGAYSEQARKLALDAIRRVDGATLYDGGIYVNNQGNQFESAAEIADLCVRLDTPRFRLQQLAKLKGETKAENLFLDRQEEFYERLAKNLNIKHAQVSMNAARELEPLVESGFEDIVLLAFPVNYGVGLIPEEKVDHERTINAIKVGTKYIAPTLKNMIQMAGDYIW
jgi:hypothetical protein